MLHVCIHSLQSETVHLKLTSWAFTELISCLTSKVHLKLASLFAPNLLRQLKTLKFFMLYRTNHTYLC